MATVTSTTVAIPSFTGLKANSNKVSAIAKVSTSTSQSPRLCVRASLKDFGVAVVATAASALLASNAMAVEVLLGASDGGLAFVPSEITVPAGETIVFKNNAGFPHNVLFDEDEVPSGVDVSKISMSDEDLLNGPGEKYEVKLDVKGTYSIYCSPHQGAGMVGKIIVT